MSQHTDQNTQTTLHINVMELSRNRSLGGPSKNSNILQISFNSVELPTGSLCCAAHCIMDRCVKLASARSTRNLEEVRVRIKELSLWRCNSLCCCRRLNTRGRHARHNHIAHATYLVHLEGEIGCSFTCVALSTCLKLNLLSMSSPYFSSPNQH